MFPQPHCGRWIISMFSFMLSAITTPSWKTSISKKVMPYFFFLLKSWFVAKYNITGYEVTVRSAFISVSLLCRLSCSQLWLGTLQWAVRSSPHLKDTTTRWEVGGKSGLGSTSLYAPPCGRWCSTLMVSQWWLCVLGECFHLPVFNWLHDFLRKSQIQLNPSQRRLICIFNSNFHGTKLMLFR